jgi:hypothetical protein
VAPAGAGSKGVITTFDPEGPIAEHGLQSGDAILQARRQRTFADVVSQGKSETIETAIRLLRITGL